MRWIEESDNSNLKDEREVAISTFRPSVRIQFVLNQNPNSDEDARKMKNYSAVQKILAKLSMNFNRTNDNFRIVTVHDFGKMQGKIDVRERLAHGGNNYCMYVI